MIWSYGLLHGILVTIAVYNLGMIMGLLSLIALHTILRIVLSPLGYQFACGNDIVHLFDTDKTPHNCLIFWEMDKISFEQLKEEGFKTTAIKNIRKFSQVPIKILGFWFWKDVSKELAYDCVQRCDMDIRSKDDLIRYSEKLINIKIPLNKPQWFIKFIENYKDDKSACMFVFHHCFSDGVGIVNSLTFFNDGSHYPKNLPTGRGVPWYTYAIYGLLVPINILKCLPELYPKRWKDWSKIKAPRGNSGSVVNLLSKTYEFKDLHKCYKKYDRMTFNNYMMGIISKSIYDWYKANNTTPQGNLCTIIPVSMKPFTLNINELDMDNHTSAVTYQFPLRENLADAITDAKKGFDFYFDLGYLIYTVLTMKAFMIIPPGIGQLLYHYFCRNVDLTFTNVPGYREPMYICNKKIDSINGFVNVYCGCNLTIAVNSYNMKVSVQMTADSQIQMNPIQLKSIIETNLDTEIASCVQNSH